LPSRVISTTARIRSLQLAECLSSLLALELLVPSPHYYLISPWITDFVIMNNGFGQYRALLPDRLDREVRLSMLLRALHERGAVLHVLTRTDSIAFVNALPVSQRIKVKWSEQLHEKTFACKNFLIDGSMNFTYTGANRSDEKVRIEVERGAVNQALLEAETRWESAE